MRLPFNPARPRARRVIITLVSILLLATAWLVGYAKGEAHVTAVVQSGLAAQAKSVVAKSNAALARYCSDYFGTNTSIAKQFGSPAFELDATSSLVQTGRVICAYRRPQSTGDELVLILTSTKPNNLVGKNGVLTQTVVRGAPSHGSIFALAASTDSKITITSADDAWLLSAAQRPLA
jgi:hypothetical protein